MPAGIVWQPCLQFRAIRGNKPATCQIVFGCTNLGWHRTAILKNKIWVFLSKTCVIFKGQSQCVVLQLPFASANHVQIFQERTRKPCYTSLVLITFPSALVEVELPGPELHPWQQRVTGLSYVFCCLSWDGEQIEWWRFYKRQLISLGSKASLQRVLIRLQGRNFPQF